MRIPKTLHGKATAALKEAVREVIKHHKDTGRPLAIWQDGKVRWISASKILNSVRISKR